MERDTEELEEQPGEQGPSIEFWIGQLDAYDRAADGWQKDTERAWDEYLADQTKNAGSTRKSSRLPVWWSSIRTMQPAIYSRTPICVTEKAFTDSTDQVARVAAILNENQAKYLLRSCPFDRVMSLTRDHYLMGGRTTAKVMFEFATKTREERRDYAAMEVAGPGGQPMTVYTDASGKTYSGEVQTDEQGPYSMEQIEEMDYLNCEPEPIHYKDVRHSPNARHWGEVDWVSFDSSHTEKEAVEMFGDDARELKYSPLSDKDKSKRKESGTIPQLYATITEIWDKKKRKVYFLSKDSRKWLKREGNPEGNDPYGLKNFFPCAPFMLGTVGPDSLFPTPDFVQLEDCIAQVHSAWDRLGKLISALRKRGVFDAAYSKLAQLNSGAGDGQFIGIDNLTNMLQGKKLEDIIMFFPTEKLAAGVQELQAALQEYDRRFNELMGIPDLLRGVSDPNETAAAQQLKGKYLSLRFSTIQREFQRLVRDTIEIMCDLMLAKCPRFKLEEIMGVRYLDPEDQQFVPAAIELLKSDTERCIRIDIQTDSTITQNMNAELEQAQFVAKVLTDGFGAIAQAGQANPNYVPVMMQSLLHVLGHTQQGKQMEDELREAIEIAKQPPPPTPDPAMAKAQAQVQVAQQKAQTEIQGKIIKTKAEIALKEKTAMAQIAQDEREAQHRMQLEQQDARNDMELRAFEAQIKVFEKKLDMLLKMFGHESDQELKREQVKQQGEAAKKPKGGDGGLTINLGGE